MKNSHSILGHLVSIFSALFLGVSLSYILIWVGSHIIVLRGEVPPEVSATSITPEPLNLSYRARVIDGQLILFPEGDRQFAKIDLESKKIFLYDGGELKSTLPILKTPEKNSPWQIGSGKYEVLRKELVHNSPFSKGTISDAVQIYGNAFVHGKSEGGVSSIELSPSDAKTFFDFAELNLPVIVVDQGNFILSAPKYGGDEANSDDAFEYKTSGITAESYLVGDLDTGEIIAEKNSKAIFPIASVSKLFTTAVAVEEKLPIEDLFYPLLLQSSNTAADKIAHATSSSGFISEMNLLAKRLGLLSTKFRDPSGLSPSNVSSAEDLFEFAKFLREERPSVLDITRLTNQGSIVNQNRFIRTKDSRYIGGKIGYIPEAGQTAISLFALPLDEFSKKNIAVIVLRSRARYEDILKLTALVEKDLYRVGGPGQAYSLARMGGSKSPAEDKKVSMLFVGDIMMDRAVESSVKKNGGGDFNYLFGYSYFLKTPAITVGNLEGPVSDKGYDLGNLYSFRMDPKAMGALRSAGFDVLSFANNHVGDYGRGAFLDTIDRGEKEGIIMAGAGRSKEEAFAPKILERNGSRIAFLAASDVGPEWLATSNEDSVPIMLSAKDPKFLDLVRKTASSSDVLVVSLHFGEEYFKDPTERQKSLARVIIDAGAKIVVGTHPHVVEKVEEYHGGLIAYSLGNFIFDQGFSKETMEGMALAVELENGKINTHLEVPIRLDEFFRPKFVDDEAF